KQGRFSWCFLGGVGSQRAPHLYLGSFWKLTSSPQLPAFFSDMGSLTTAMCNPAHLVKFLFFVTLLMTLVTLLTLVWKLTENRSKRNREPPPRKVATWLA
ncbi:small integral membrane protein 42-like, partial [Callithrix jacchus]